MVGGKRFWSVVAGLLLILHGAVFTGCQTIEVSQHRDHVSARGELIPLGRVDPGQISVDGDLSDWGDMRDGAVALHQEFGHTFGPFPEGECDAALVKVLHDEEAVYVAMRVADSFVVNPFDRAEYWKGDCVELYFDTRLLTGDGPKMGDSSYSDGVHELLIVPPTGAGKPLRWRQGDQKVREVDSIDVAGRFVEEGYELELRVAFGDDVDASRLTQPIGFEVMIGDADSKDGQENLTPARAYSWSGIGDYDLDPSRFACLDVQRGDRPTSPYIHVIPARALEEGERTRFKTALVTTLDATDVADRFRLAHRFAATDFDRPANADVPAEAFFAESDEVTSDVYSFLGIAVHKRALSMEKLAPGRYYFETFFPGLDIAPQLARYYGRFTRGRVRLEKVMREVEGFDVLKNIATNWARAELETHYAIRPEGVGGKVNVFPSTVTWFALSEEAQQVAQAGEAAVTPYAVRLELVRWGHDERVWRRDVPVKSNGSSFQIPTKDLAEGRYELRLLALGPNEQSLPIAWEETSARVGTFTLNADRPFVVMAPHEIELKSSVQDAPNLLTRAVKIGDPARAQFPKDDVEDCQARSIHDLHLYEGRIYIGYGDWNTNRGPIDIWSFEPVQDGEQLTFVKEFTVDDESVDVFRDFDGKLYVPGIDSADKVEDQWALGNLYVKSDGKWHKFRTVPNGIHVLDAAEFDGKLYVTAGTESGAALFESDDGAKTWERCGESFIDGQYRFHEVVPLDDFLLVTSESVSAAVYKYADGKLERLLIPMFPGCKAKSWAPVHRLKRFQTGVVYLPYWIGSADARPLFYLDDFEHGAVVVGQFRDAHVRDILVLGGMCYVLTAEKQHDESPAFTGNLHTSSDLKRWTRLATFGAPSLPNSIGLANGTFYVGLANHDPWKSADAASGTIWRIVE